MLTNIFIYVCLFLLARAAEITNITFSDLSLAPSGPRNPALAWLTTFNFNIDDASTIRKGDTFSVDLANVYRVKFNNESAIMDIKLADGTIAFLCYVSQQGSYKYDTSIFTCIAQEDLTSYNSISGEISFSLSFNNGGSTKYEPELIGAKLFKAGTQSISLNSQLSAIVSFATTINSDRFYSLGRTTTYNSMESYYLNMNCSSGYIISGKETINYDYQNGGYKLDCSSLQVATSNNLNDFLFPLNASTSNIDYFCFDDTVTINVGESAFDSLLFINGLQSAPNNVNSIVHRLDAAYTCMNTIASTTYSTSFSVINTFVVTQGQNYAVVTFDPLPIVSSTLYLTTNTPQIIVTSTTTTGWTGSFRSTYSTETTVITDSLGSTTPEVIIHIETPSTFTVPLTTITSATTTGWTGSFRSTYSTETTVITDSLGSTTPEVIIHIETPSTFTVPLTTITSATTTGWTGSFRSTYSTETTVITDSLGFTTPEVIIHIETPSTFTVPLTTITSATTTGWTGSFRSTYSTETTVITDSLGSTTPEVIIHIETPSTFTVPLTTITSATTTGWTGSFRSTYSTETTVITDSLGFTTPEVIIHIETPLLFNRTLSLTTPISTHDRNSVSFDSFIFRTYTNHILSLSSSPLFDTTGDITRILSTSDITSTSSNLISIESSASSWETSRVIVQTQSSTTSIDFSASKYTSVIPLFSIIKSSRSTPKNTYISTITSFTDLTTIPSFSVVFPSTTISLSQNNDTKSTLNTSSIHKVQYSSTHSRNEETIVVPKVIQFNSGTTRKPPVNVPSKATAFTSHLEMLTTSSTTNNIISIFSGTGNSLKVTSFVSGILTLISVLLLG
ncbi:Sag1p PWA37_000184 [Arxiozyma heterogenica]|uniref:Sag1p n=1 Tax=Arxiozyma heterogenica TaxID=278026 RepID=UPI002F1DA0D4